MKSVKKTVKLESVFSKDETHRYVHSRIWDKAKKLVTVITIYPGELEVGKEDLTMMLCQNACVELGYGGVYFVNLFSKANLSSRNKKLFKGAVDDKTDELIKQCADVSDTVIFAYGSVVKTSEVANERAKEVEKLLVDCQEKCFFLVNENGETVHPLSSIARTGWTLTHK